ncbi:MAG: hypothetical protein ACRDD3_13445, partial [Azovibrio sp.]
RLLWRENRPGQLRMASLMLLMITYLMSKNHCLELLQHLVLLQRKPLRWQMLLGNRYQKLLIMMERGR